MYRERERERVDGVDVVAQPVIAALHYPERPEAAKNPRTIC